MRKFHISVPPNAPRSMRVARNCNHGLSHFYIDPGGIEIYTNGQAKVRLTKKQIESIVHVLYDYVPPANPQGEPKSG